MRAITCTGAGGPEVLTVSDIERPTLKPGQLLIETVAAGVNRADLLQRQGHYPPPAGITDIIGFLSFRGVKLSLVADFGLFAAIGLFFTAGLAVTAFLLDGPETLLRHIGLDEQDTYTTKHEIDDLVTVVHITREEAPAWQH